MSLREHPRPVVVVSQCLDLDACRYNGERIRAPFISILAPYAELRPVCPEVEIGLGIPRAPIRIAVDGGRPRLVQPDTGRDLTAAMQSFTAEFLGAQDAVDGFILKSRSPSCGIKDTKFYSADGTQPSGRGAGLFGAGVLERFPSAAVEDEGRLTNFRLRHHFLTKLHLRAAFRAVRADGAMGTLVQFHAANKFLLMAYHQSALRELGRIVANPERRPMADVLDAYERGLGVALERPARSTSNINAMMHLMGYFSERLGAGERQHFLGMLEHYRAKRVDLGAPLAVMQSWVARFEQPYVRQQTYLEPYPVELLHPHDSGRGN